MKNLGNNGVSTHGYCKNLGNNAGKPMAVPTVPTFRVNPLRENENSRLTGNQGTVGTGVIISKVF